MGGITRIVIGREQAVEALAALCRNYRDTALRAVREGRVEVYIPIGDPLVERGQTLYDLLAALRNPSGLLALQSTNGPGEEPCYASEGEFLKGRNKDGSPHGGYLLVDVISKLVVGLAPRSGFDILGTLRYNQKITPDEFVANLHKRGLESYCLD